MAVLPVIPGLDVTVVVDGVEAQEYDAPEDEIDDHRMNLEDFDPAYTHHATIPHVIRYIEAKPGAPFFYRIKLSPNYVFHSHHIGYRVKNDGDKRGVRHIFKSDKRPDGSIVTTRGSTVVRDPKVGYKELTFCFAPLTLDEADNIESSVIQEQMKTASEYGCLQVSFFRLGEGGRIWYEATSRDWKNSTNLSEKALKGKAIDCVASFTEMPIADGGGYTYKSNFVDQRKRPFAVFEFRYRSKDGLMAEGIIQRPIDIDEDEPIPDDQKIVKEETATSLTLEEVNGMSNEEVRRRLAELIAQNRSGNSATKREAPIDEAEFAARYKTRKLNNGSLEIDLTDD